MKLKWPSILLFGTLAGMELCWLWAILDLLGRKAALSLPGLFFVAFYLLPFGLKRLFLALRWRRPNLPGCVACAAAVLAVAKIQFFGAFGWWNPDWVVSLVQAAAGIFHSFTPESVFILSAAILWGCGWRLATLRPKFATLISEFQFGLAILFAAHFAYAQLELKFAGLIPVTLGFFLFGLSGISVAHGLEGTGWLSGPRKGRWFGVLFFSIGLILGAGLLISLAVGPSLVEFLFSVVSEAGRLILKALEIFFGFLNQFFVPPKTGGLPPSMRPPSKGPADVPFVLFSDSTREVMRFLWTVLVLSLVLVALWRISSQIFEWLRRKLGEMEDVAVEPLSGAFREDVLNFLRRLVLAITNWLFRRRKRSPRLPSQVESARRVYRQLLAWAASRGVPRTASQTPHEYLQTLLDWLPQNGGDLTFITDEYVRARYSPFIPTEKGLQELRQSWRKLKKSGSRKAARKKTKEQEINNG
jgi:hypothetical protein